MLYVLFNLLRNQIMFYKQCAQSPQLLGSDLAVSTPKPDLTLTLTISSFLHALTYLWICTLKTPGSDLTRKRVRGGQTHFGVRPTRNPGQTDPESESERHFGLRFRSFLP